MIREVVQFMESDDHKHGLVIFMTYYEMRGWLGEHGEILEKLGYQYSTGGQQWSNIRGNQNCLKLFIYTGPGSSRQLHGHSFNKYWSDSWIPIELEELIRSRMMR